MVFVWLVGLVFVFLIFLSVTDKFFKGKHSFRMGFLRVAEKISK